MFDSILIHLLQFLATHDEYKLSQLNRSLREFFLSPACELKHFREVMRVYRGHADSEERELRVNMNLKLNPNLLKIGSWLAVASRLESLMDCPSGHKLLVGHEEWTRRHDLQLNKLRKSLQYLSSSYIDGCIDPQDDRYLVDLALLDFPSGHYSDVMSDISKQDFEKLSFGLSKKECFFSWMRAPVGIPFYKAAQRLVYVDTPGTIPALRACRIPKLTYGGAQILHPFVVRAVMQDPDIRAAALNCSSPNHVPPYALLRWCRGLDATSKQLMSKFSVDPLQQFLDNSAVLEMDIHSLWDQNFASPLGGGLSALGGLHPKNCVEVLRKSALKVTYHSHWNSTISEIEDHLKNKFRPFSLEQADEMIKASGYSTHDITESSVGAYLEVCLSDSEYNPNPSLALNDHNGDIDILYIGPTNALLYRYKEWHC